MKIGENAGKSENANLKKKKKSEPSNCQWIFGGRPNLFFNYV